MMMFWIYCAARTARWLCLILTICQPLTSTRLLTGGIYDCGGLTTLKRTWLSGLRAFAIRIGRKRFFSSSTKTREPAPDSLPNFCRSQNALSLTRDSHMIIPRASLKFHPRSMCCQFMLACLLLLGSYKSEAQAQATSLAELQRAYAMRYLEPEPHMALAKYYFDHGDRIEAFFITEAARRGRFEEKIFNPAFYRAFDGFDNNKGAEARLLAEYAR